MHVKVAEAVASRAALTRLGYPAQATKQINLICGVSKVHHLSSSGNKESEKKMQLIMTGWPG